MSVWLRTGVITFIPTCVGMDRQHIATYFPSDWICDNRRKGCEMAGKRKGQLVSTQSWAAHMRPEGRRTFWKAERKAAKAYARNTEHWFFR